ncbi:MAG TPA: DUF2007 domain-containing protein [Vicinamibacterales bacterium]|jgi:hypothetical protein
MPRRQWVIVYAGGTADATVLRDLLEGSGVSAMLADEVMGTMAPFVIAAGNAPAVKVLVPEDQLDDARDVVVDFAVSSKAIGRIEGAPWRCRRCGEENEPQFDTCWNCQAEKA